MSEQFCNVTLSDGRVVKVYPVPPYVLQDALAQLVEPIIPKRKVNPEAAILGVTDDQLIDNPEDPEYIRAHTDWMRQRIEKFVDVRLVFGLRDESVPEKWPTETDKERWEFLGLKVELPKSKIGKQLTWIKYGLLQSGQDMDLVLATIGSFTDADKEEIQKLVASFRHTS